MDIVERLRQDWTCPICHDGIGEVVLEAAAEIARLRGEVWEWRQAADAEAAERRAAHADIERLRAECVRLEDHINDADDESIRLRAERDEADRRAGAVERKLNRYVEQERKMKTWLRDAKEEQGYSDNDSFDDVWKYVLTERDRLRAEVERLTAEVRDWRDAAKYDVVMEGPRAKGE